MAEQQDARVIENLLQAGSDLSKPHNIDFFFYFPNEAQANAAAAEIAKLGYKVVAVDNAQDKSQWQVYATRTMAPQLEAIIAITQALEELASRHGGNYDGWGTEVVR
jgi:regulator of RNase E activity RraB